MLVAIPPAFAVFARGEVAAGRFASEEDVVVRALETYLDRVADIRSAVEEGFASLDRGEGVDGPTFMRDLIREMDDHPEG